MTVIPPIRLVDNSDPVSRGDVDHRFGLSGMPTLTPEQIKRLQSIREHLRLLARHVLADCPNSWEREEAVKALDETYSWAAKAISRHE